MSVALMVWDEGCFGDIFTKDHCLTDRGNYEGVSRIALATQVLLNMQIWEC